MVTVLRYLTLRLRCHTLRVLPHVYRARLRLYCTLAYGCGCTWITALFTDSTFTTRIRLVVTHYGWITHYIVRSTPPVYARYRLLPHFIRLYTHLCVYVAYVAAPHCLRLPRGCYWLVTVAVTVAVGYFTVPFTPGLDFTLWLRSRFGCSRSPLPQFTTRHWFITVYAPTVLPVLPCSSYAHARLRGCAVAHHGLHHYALPRLLPRGCYHHRFWLPTCPRFSATVRSTYRSGLPTGSTGYLLLPVLYTGLRGYSSFYLHYWFWFTRVLPVGLCHGLPARGSVCVTGCVYHTCCHGLHTLLPVGLPRYGCTLPFYLWFCGWLDCCGSLLVHTRCCRLRLLHRVWFGLLRGCVRFIWTLHTTSWIPLLILPTVLQFDSTAVAHFAVTLPVAARLRAHVYTLPVGLPLRFSSVYCAVTRFTTTVAHTRRTHRLPHTLHWFTFGLPLPHGSDSQLLFLVAHTRTPHTVTVAFCRLHTRTAHLCGYGYGCLTVVLVCGCSWIRAGYRVTVTRTVVTFALRGYTFTFSAWVAVYRLGYRFWLRWLRLHTRVCAVRGCVPVTLRSPVTLPHTYAFPVRTLLRSGYVLLRGYRILGYCRSRFLYACHALVHIHTVLLPACGWLHGLLRLPRIHCVWLVVCR